MNALRTLAAAFLLVAASCDLATDPGLATVESSAIGLALRELPRGTLRTMGLSYGLAVIRVEAAAAHSGLRLGDVIYGVNQRRIGSMVEFARVLAEQPPGSPVALLVRRGELDLYLPLRPGEAGPRRRPTDTLLRT
jgi:S1-C subfamily serine protease